MFGASPPEQDGSLEKIAKNRNTKFRKNLR